jgi:branched-chain amino acid transport system substrate-binding protein
MQKLVNRDKIVVAIGHYNSSCTLASMQVTERAKVPHICPISTAAAITESGNKYIFRNCATNPMQVGQLTQWAFDNLTKGDKNPVAVLYENTDYGKGLSDIFLERVKNNPKWQLTATESYNQGDTDMIAQLTKIKESNPKVLMIGGNLTEAAVIIRQSKELGLKVQFMGLGGGFSNDRFAELAGVENVEGIVNVSYFEKSSTNPLAQEFVKNYIAKYNKDPDMFGAATYEAVDIVAKVAPTLKDADFKDITVFRAAMRDGIANLKELPGVQGPTTFDETGQADKMVYIIRWENGKRVIVYPTF